MPLLTYIFHGDCMILKRSLRGFVALAAVGLFIVCLTKSSFVAEYTYDYLILCGKRVVPGLFVFSVLGTLVASGDSFGHLCKLLPRYGTELGLLILGLCGGFPLGASVATELYGQGQITKRQGEYLCTFTNTPSLAFIIGYTGGVLNSPRAGIMLAVFTFVAAVVTAVIFRPMLNKEERIIAIGSADRGQKSFTAALSDGCKSMISICGSIMFFGGISWLLPLRLRGFLELSTGIANCTNATEAACLLGFSGISVMCQVGAVSRGRLNIAPFIAAKTLQCVILWFLAQVFID